MRTRIPPVIIALINALIIWAVDYYLLWGDLVFPGQALLASLFLACGVYITFTAIQSFRLVETTVNPIKPTQATALVIKGIYNYTRNPMYLGMLIMLSAEVIYLGNVFACLGLIIFVIAINGLQIKPEEQALTEKFGEAYLDYLSDVRRWL